MTRASLFEVTRYSKPPVPGYDGIVQRAGSQGGKDNQYDAYHAAVMKYDVRIAYHYLGSATPWTTQANSFASIVGNDFQVLACDLEDGGNVRSKAFVSSAVEFLLSFQRKGFHVILYTNADMYKYAVAQDARIAQFELWFAWPADSIAKAALDTYFPASPKPWTLWQFAFGEHEQDSFEKDVFNGTADDLRRWAGVAVAPVLDQPVVIQPPSTSASVPTSVTLTFWADGKTTATDWRKT